MKVVVSKFSRPVQLELYASTEKPSKMKTYLLLESKTCLLDMNEMLASAKLTPSPVEVSASQHMNDSLDFIVKKLEKEGVTALLAAVSCKSF